MVLNLFQRDKIFKPSDQIDEYLIVKVIGEGQYGICYQVIQNQKPYILKQLKKGVLKKTGAKACFEEEILKGLRHEGIPRFIKKIECENFCGFVLEFKEGDTFEDVIFINRYVFNRPEIYRVGRQLIQILKYLHAKGVVHRDIRVPNTLYDGQKVSLVDFGLARLANNKKYRTDMDFAFLGDFLLHLYYTSFEYQGKKGPWYEELNLTEKELLFLKRLMGIEQRFNDIAEVEYMFNKAFHQNNLL